MQRGNEPVSDLGVVKLNELTEVTSGSCQNKIMSFYN